MDIANINSSEFMENYKRRLDLLNIPIEEKNILLARCTKKCQKAYDKFWEQLVISELRYKCQLGIENSYIQDIYNENAKMRLELLKKNENPINQWIWLTIRPPEFVTFMEFKKQVDKMLTKKWLKTYLYVYEQTGVNEKELGKGKHLHILINRHNKKQSHAETEIRNTFKAWFDYDKPEAHHYFNYMNIHENFIKIKIANMLGNKESTSENNKYIKQHYDRLFRKKMYLKDFYKSEDFIIPDDIQFYNNSTSLPSEDAFDIYKDRVNS